jgi:Ran GTPase-activating protein (RanGAP) involved in mRNA processing and transport
MIYAAKCRDSDIAFLPEPMMRFCEFCSRNIKNRKFALQNSGLGPEAAGELARILKNNSHYGQLELGLNVLSDKGSFKLMKVLSRSFNLVHIGLSNNDISPEGAASIFRSLLDNQSITSLDLSSQEGLHRNRLAAQGCEPLAVLFKANPVLVHLNLAGTAIGPEGLEYVSKGFKGNQSVLTLNLASNGLYGRTIEPFARAVLGTRLRLLDLSSNRFAQQGAECIARMLQGGFEGSCPLQHLDISKNEISFAGAARIFTALTRNSTLKSMNMEGNPLGSSSTSELHTFLAENKALTVLNLSGCELKADGIAAISDGLVKNHVLLTLNLAWNSLEDVGAIMLGTALSRNDTLRSLDLSSNRIKDPGGAALCEGLKYNRGLEVLNLQDNSLHDATGQLLAETSRINHSLIKILLKMNPITQKYLAEIQGNMGCNRVTLRKSMIPQLKNDIKKLIIREDAMLELETVELKKKTEEEELKRQLQESEEKYDRFKADEERKFAQVKGKLEEVMRTKQKVGEEYAALEDEIFVIGILERKAQRR